mmetsp:Transcript_33529/g.107108  ORF Transcript_33529/g.107108 Transcript_33529/m.107108 type:complete len:660 (-) Transcript_33529:314-2293(-)
MMRTPTAELVVEGALDCSVGDERAKELLREAGVVVLKATVEREALAATQWEGRVARVMEAVGRRRLTEDADFAFAEACARGRGRVDVKLDDGCSPLSLSSKAVTSVVEDALGGDVVVADRGVVLSLPGSPAQRWHRDGSPLFPESGHSLPAHAVTAFYPLTNVDEGLGPTQFLLGSHVAAQDDPRFVEPIRNTPYAAPCLDVGDVVLFDYRIVHRGGPNKSSPARPRPLLYVVYRRSWFVDVQNFPETRRSIFLKDDDAENDDKNDDDEKKNAQEPPTVFCVDEDEAYSETDLARTPSGQLPPPRPRPRPRRSSSSSEEAEAGAFDFSSNTLPLNVEFEGLVGVEAVRALEAKCNFAYVSTTAYLRSRDLRDRQLLFAPPARRAKDLGVDIDARAVASVAVRPVPEVDGYGLFATEALPPGTLVAEYAGIVAPAFETTGPSVFDGYALEYAQGLDGRTLRISSKHFGNVARFVNHDPDHPNAELVAAIPDSGLRRILVVTVTAIQPDEQILMDYGAAYWHGADVLPVQLKGGKDRRQRRRGEVPSSSSSSSSRPTTTTTTPGGPAAPETTTAAAAVAATTTKKNTTKAKVPAAVGPLWTSPTTLLKAHAKSLTPSLKGIASSVLRAIEGHDDVGPPEDDAPEKTPNSSALYAWRDLDTW